MIIVDGINNFKQYWSWNVKKCYSMEIIFLFFSPSVEVVNFFWKIILLAFYFMLEKCYMQKNVASANTCTEHGFFWKIYQLFFFLCTAHHQLCWITGAYQGTPEAADAPVLLWMWLSTLPESREGRLGKEIPCQWNRIF